MRVMAEAVAEAVVRQRHSCGVCASRGVCCGGYGYGCGGCRCGHGGRRRPRASFQGWNTAPWGNAMGFRGGGCVGGVGCVEGVG